MSDVVSSTKNNRVVFIGLLLVFGVIAWYLGRGWIQEDKTTPSSETTETTDTSLADVRFLTAKEILSRINRNEDLLIIDVRTRDDFDSEHIVDAVSVPVTTLSNFSSPKGKLLIVSTGPDIPNETIKGIHTLFTERQYNFAFLEGGLAEWTLAGGSTISTGDPASLFDYSKVVFVNPGEIEAAFNNIVNLLLLDVRSESLFEKEHAPEAINIPLAELEKRRSEIPRGVSIFVYGSNDYESYQAGVRLFDLNFFGARVIKGGFSGWKEQGLPVVTAGTTEHPSSDNKK